MAPSLVLFHASGTPRYGKSLVVVVESSVFEELVLDFVAFD
jgi:hypothetical protein